jgi:hypothetical protein
MATGGARRTLWQPILADILHHAASTLENNFSRSLLAGLDALNYDGPPVFLLSQWLICGHQRVIRLPPQYVVKCMTTRAGTVAIGRLNGRVTVIGFDESALLSELSSTRPFHLVQRRSLSPRSSSGRHDNRPSFLRKLLPGWARSRRKSGRTASSGCNQQDNEQPSTARL